MIRGALLNKNVILKKKISKRSFKKFHDIILKLSSLSNSVHSINYINNWESYRNFNIDYENNKYLNHLMYYFSHFTKNNILPKSSNKINIWKMDIDMFLDFYSTDLDLLAKNIMKRIKHYNYLCISSRIINIFSRSSLLFIDSFINIENVKKVFKFNQKCLYHSISDFILFIIMKNIKNRYIMENAEKKYFPKISSSISISFHNEDAAINNIKIIVSIIKVILKYFNEELYRGKDFESIFLDFFKETRKNLNASKISDIEIRKSISNFILFFTEKKIVLFSEIKFSYIINIICKDKKLSVIGEGYTYFIRDIFNGMILIAIDKDADKLTFILEDYANKVKKHISKKYSEIDLPSRI